MDVYLFTQENNNMTTAISTQYKKSCIACLYTGWGKTFASLYIAYVLGVKTLIIVNKESLLKQWEEQIVNFFGINRPSVESDVFSVNVLTNVLFNSVEDFTIEFSTDSLSNYIDFSWDKTKVSVPFLLK